MCVYGCVCVQVSVKIQSVDDTHVSLFSLGQYDSFGELAMVGGGWVG
jgi:hypothetical protein